MTRFNIIDVNCDRKESLNLSYIEKKLLNRLDIELSYKNPNTHCSIKCKADNYNLFISNGKVLVNSNYNSREKLFKRLEVLSYEIDSLQFDVSSHFINEEIIDKRREQRHRKIVESNKLLRY